MDERKDKNIVSKLICVLLSFSLWFYVTNIENPTRTSTIRNVSVDVLNEDVLAMSGLALTPNQNLKMDLKIEGPANKIYSLNASNFSLAVDLQDYALKVGTNNIPVKIEDYPDDINIKNEDVLSIKVQIEKLTEKKFEIKNNVNTTFAPGYLSGSQSITPDSVKVLGPESLVKKVAAVSLVGDAKNISKNYSGTFEIKALDNSGNEVDGVTLSNTTGTLSIQTKKRKQVDVKINYTGALPTGLTLSGEKLSKSTVNITGNIASIDGVEDVQLEPINLNNVTSSGDVVCKLVIPDNISCDEDTITVNLTIQDDRVVTKTINVPIDYSDENSGFSYNRPSSVNITVSGKDADLSNVSTSNISVKASLKGITAVGDGQTVNWTATIADANNVTIPNSSGTINVDVTKK